MPSVVAYHRPGTLDEASALLTEPNTRAIGGGTVVVPASRQSRDVGTALVDLQALGLDQIESDGEHGEHGNSGDGGRVRIGAMVRLGDLVDDDSVPPLLRELARRELPSALRNQATVGGTIAAAEPESVLFAGLLAYGAEVELHPLESKPLEQLVAEGRDLGSRIVTAVSFDTAGSAAWAGTGRTPKDTPIVAAVVHRAATGSDATQNTTVVLTGVATTPVVVDPADPVAALDPPSDFRGSAGYRRHLAATLTERALEGLA